MADKTIDQLTELTTLEANDLLIAYDVSELGPEKIRKITKTNAFIGVGGGDVTTAQLTSTSGALQTNINGKAATSHDHDSRYFTETELTNGQLDTRYYTESEVNTISGVLNTSIGTKFNTTGGNVSGNVCIGTNPIGFALELSGLSKNIANVSYSSTYTNWQGSPYLTLMKSHSNTIGTLSTTQTGETLAQMNFRGVSSANTSASAAAISFTQIGAAGSGEWTLPTAMSIEFGTAGGAVQGMYVSATVTTIPYLSGTGNRAVYSTSTGSLTNTASDQSLKKNIEPLTYGLSEVLKMNPIKFNWIPEDLGQQKEIGFVAQEMEAVVPEVVGTNTDGMKSLDYPKLVAVLCKAIQELEARLVAAGL